MQGNPSTIHPSIMRTDQRGRFPTWDAHACMPLSFNHDLSELERHRQAGTFFVSINVGMDFNPVSQVIRVIAGYRDWLLAHGDRFVLVRSCQDVLDALGSDRLAVAFDLEGAKMLENDLAMLPLYRDLGVRQIHLAYNRNNAIAGGCHDGDRGLTALGRRVVARINAEGVIMDCAHSSRQTSLEIMEASTRPVVFSHANVRALCDHPRNIDNDQIDACAATDGVVGVSGVNAFLGGQAPDVTRLVEHIDYLVERVGPRHVGLGLDYCFDSVDDDLPDTEDVDYWWPPEQGYGDDALSFVPPELLPQIAELLTQRGYSHEHIGDIMGGNFLRVAQKTWT